MFRVLGAVWGAAMAGLLAAAFTIGGFDVDDPQLEEALHWVRAFAAEQPRLTPALAAQCAARMAASPLLTRDRTVQLFACVRRQAEASRRPKNAVNPRTTNSPHRPLTAAR